MFSDWVNFSSFVERARKKFENHLWCLSIRLVPPALYSGSLDLTRKQQLRTTMMKFKGLSPSAKQEMSFSITFEKNPQRFCRARKLENISTFRCRFWFSLAPATKWLTMESYQKGKHVVSNLPVVNDAVERALGSAKDTNTKTAPESKNERQDLYKVIRGARGVLRTKTTSEKTVPKKSLAAVNYNWLSS